MIWNRRIVNIFTAIKEYCQKLKTEIIFEMDFNLSLNLSESRKGGMSRRMGNRGDVRAHVTKNLLTF